MGSIIICSFSILLTVGAIHETTQARYAPAFWLLSGAVLLVLVADFKGV